MAEWTAVLIFAVLQAVLVVTAASFVFDAVHWLLHQWTRSRYRLLRSVGALHQAHHRFLDRKLQVHSVWARDNMVHHLVPEALTQIVVCGVFYAVLPWLPVLLAQGWFTVIFGLSLFVNKGLDPHHRPRRRFVAPHAFAAVTPVYHALHHAYPDAYFSSYVRLFDILFGTGCIITGRRFVVTGSSGAFGKPLCAALVRAGAASVQGLKFGTDWTYESLAQGDTPALDAALAEADVLILAHGSKLERALEANSTSFIAIIERFKQLTAERLFAPEVWAMGSEIETCLVLPSWHDLRIYKDSKVAYARQARRYYRDPQILYRHIVASSFTSPMGPGLMSGRFTAAAALFLIKRGFRYIPVTYTGLAFVNFGKFLPLLPRRR